MAFYALFLGVRVCNCLYVGVLDFGCVHVQLMRDFKFQLLPPDSRCFLAGGVAAREPRLVCCCDNSTIMTLKSPVSLGNFSDYVKIIGTQFYTLHTSSSVGFSRSKYINRVREHSSGLLVVFDHSGT